MFRGFDAGTLGPSTHTEEIMRTRFSQLQPIVNALFIRILAACFALVGLTWATSPAAAEASGPELTVPRSDLAAAFKCPIDPTTTPGEPIMFVIGTGATGDQGYLIGQGAWELYGHPVCYMNFPDFTTADIQVSVQYLVYGLRREYRLSRRKVAAYGVSQGGLLSRFALTYWPDLRNKVSDVVAAAGTQHGTNIDLGCSASTPCTPADWQQQRHSNLLDAINSQADETPGDVSYTTVRSLTDERVRPQGGRHPTSALDGARNIVIQNVCPGRVTTHIGTGVDSVMNAAFVDAVAHNGKGKKGAANVARFPSDVCSHPYSDGLDEAQTSLFLNAAGGLLGNQSASSPKVPAEPRVHRVFIRQAP